MNNNDDNNIKMDNINIDDIKNRNKSKNSDSNNNDNNNSRHIAVETFNLNENDLDSSMMMNDVIKNNKRDRKKKKKSNNMRVESTTEVLPSFVIIKRLLFSKRFILIALLSSIVLWYAETISFLLFHLIIELFTSFISLNMFLWSYGARDLIDNQFLHFICISQISSAVLDFFHALTYNHMTVFDAVSWHDPLDTPTQLWISGRLIQALSLLIAPYFVKTRELPSMWYNYCLLIYVIIIIIVFILLMTETFPTCLDKNGLTDFKIGMEYFISITFILSILHLIYQKKINSSATIEKPHRPVLVQHQRLDEIIRGENKYLSSFSNDKKEEDKEQQSAEDIVLETVEAVATRHHTNDHNHNINDDDHNHNINDDDDHNHNINDDDHNHNINDDSDSDEIDNEPNNANNICSFNFEPLFIWLVLHIICLTVSEFIFTLYKKPTDRFNMIAHMVRFYATLFLYKVCFSGMYRYHLMDIKNDLNIKTKQLLYYNGVLAGILNKEDQKQQPVLSPRLLKFVRDNATTRFQSLVSHEIRTPLNAIVGLAEILRASNTLQPEDAEMVTTMYHSGISLVALLNDLLDLGKIESKEIALHQDNFNFTNTCQSVIALFLAMAQKKFINITFIQNIKTPKKQIRLNDEYNIFVVGDELRFSQILRNLLSNAIKFTPARGNIIIEVNIIKNNNINLDTYLKQSEIKDMKIEVKVIDDGVGIKENRLESIFVPFKQIDDNVVHTHVQGTGLGLSICHGLVHCMNGEIGVFNNKTVNSESKGCTFYVITPFKIGRLLTKLDDPLIDLANDITNNVAGRHSLAAMPALQNVRAEKLYRSRESSGSLASNEMKDVIHILLVEDSGVNQKVQSRMLKMLFKTLDKHLKLDVADNGLEALATICRRNFQQDVDGNHIEVNDEVAYDIVLMDQMMPIMGGLECTMEIRKIERNKCISKANRLVIIAQTGLLNNDIHDTEIYDDYLAKPITRKSLEQIITKYI